MPNSKNSGSKSTRGGTPQQHAEAGRQSHKNDTTKSGKQGRGKGSSKGDE